MYEFTDTTKLIMQAVFYDKQLNPFLTLLNFIGISVIYFNALKCLCIVLHGNILFPFSFWAMHFRKSALK